MIARKKKIGIFFYSLPRSIQNIAHHIQSKKDGVISEGGWGVCMSLSGKKPKLFIPYIEKQLKRTNRVEVIWDRYFKIN